VEIPFNINAAQSNTRSRLRYPWWGRIGIKGGIICAWYYFISLLGEKIKRPLIPIRLKNIFYPFYARFGSSDGAVFNQIFTEQEYACVRDIENPRLIIDCGANVGYSSIWFLQHFPCVKIIAVEPDSKNFNLCKKNLQTYGGQVTLVQAGVWPVAAGLIVENGKDGREWAYRVRESREDEKPHLCGVPIDRLLDESDCETIDILKIDIETAEKILFSKNYESWMRRVKNIVIELHGPDCEEVFFKAMSGYEYDLSRSGELTVCRDISPKMLSAVMV